MGVGGCGILTVGFSCKTLLLFGMEPMADAGRVIQNRFGSSNGDGFEDVFDQRTLTNTK